MTRKEFTDYVTSLVDRYIEVFNLYDSDPQIKVNPTTLAADLINGSEMMTDIEYADEAVEEAAGAENESYNDAMDSQAAQNPDFYPVKKLLAKNKDGHATADSEAIDAIADRYFR